MKGLLLLWMLATLAPVLAATPETKPVQIAFIGAALFDGTGGKVRENSAILVSGDRIVWVGGASELKIPANAQVVRVQGRFIIPGLINSHVHLATEANPKQANTYLRRELYSGITAVRDMAGDVRLLAELKREAFFNEIVSPDIFYAALMAGPSFFRDPRTHDAAKGLEAGAVPWMQAISAATALPLAVAAARGTGATAIKIYADLPGGMVTAITAEAHRQHMLVWAHAAVFPATPLDVANAGVDVMSHADFLAYQLSDPMPPTYAAAGEVSDKARNPNPRMDAVLELMKQRNIILDATVDVSYRYPSAKWPPGLAAAITQQAYRHGLAISAGTDDDADWHDPDSALDAEITRLVKDVGMTPADALICATAVGSRTFGQQQAMGTVTPGKLANFVILQRDPLADIDNIRSVLTVVKRGVQYQRSDYRPATPGAP